MSLPLQLFALRGIRTTVCPYKSTTTPTTLRCSRFPVLYEFRGPRPLGRFSHSSRGETFILLCPVLVNSSYVIIRMGKERRDSKEPSGRKSCVDVGGGAGAGMSSPAYSTGPEEHHSLASDDSVGPVSNVVLIPRLPAVQYEISSSLGYSSTRGKYWARPILSARY